MTNEIVLGDGGYAQDQVLVIGRNPVAVRAASVLAAHGIDARLIGCPDTVAGAGSDAQVRTAVVVPPGGGESIPVAGGARMRVLESGRSTEHRLGITELSVPPGVAPAPVHRHTAHDEGFYVLSGTVRFFVGADHVDAPAGTFVLVPPGVDHGFANPTDVDAVLLNTFTPDIYLDFFRDMAALRAEGVDITREKGVEVMARYATFPSAAGTPEAGS